MSDMENNDAELPPDGPSGASKAVANERVDDVAPSSSDVDDDDTTQSAAADRKQVRKERLLLLLKTPSFVVGMAILLFWVAVSVRPSAFSKYGDQEVVRVDGSVIARVGPRADAWFGTDTIGNDVFARVMFGARPILATAVVAAIVAVIAGTLLGLIVGYFRGWVDEIISRIIEAFLSIPVILLAILVLSLFGRSKLVIVATIALLFTPVVTRTIRSAVLAEAQLDYVTSARLRGENAVYVMTREILPNITGVAVVELTVRVGYAIFTVATLSFLGLNAGDSSAADWGRDITTQYKTIQAGQWWASIFPALAIGSLVIAVNLVADSIDRANKS